MERRVVLFLTLSLAILFGNYYLQVWLRGDAGKQVVQQDEKKEAKAKKAEDKNGKQAADQPEAQAGKGEKADAGAPEKPADEKPAAAPEPEVEEQRFSLGSADPTTGYRMLATFTNRGAALERVELNHPRYLELEDRSGYMGYLAPADAKGGALIRVVGDGTPAAAAGLQVGDVITKLNEIQITDAAGFVAALQDRENRLTPGENVEITYRRNGADQVTTATLTRVPAQVIRPEQHTPEAPEPVWVVKKGNHDPLSLRLTLHAVDGRSVDEAERFAELPGVDLYEHHWRGRKIDQHTVEFERVLPRFNLRLVKRFDLAKADENEGEMSDYHLAMTIEVHNQGEAARDVAYQLDGPNGLPIDGWWYHTRISTDWGGGLGIRDAALRFEGRGAALIGSPTIADGAAAPPRKESAEAPLVYGGVDSQYFASVLLPLRKNAQDVWFSRIEPIRVGDVPAEPALKKLANVTTRLVTRTYTVDPGKTLTQEYQVFVGPKKPELLAQYGTDSTTLSELVYYGWAIWGVFATLLTRLLHFFYAIVGNYGIAIVMLTVLVRLCMFPLSRKQALAAQKMQELKPEMDRINAKHKGNNEARARAMQELWKKHNYNPMGGCLLAFIQLPIFIGLYRALMIDVELRGAPLFTEAIRWCSDLSAPDMLWRWEPYLPAFIAAPAGWLGPYFNVLPIVTVALFLFQQKMFMPPATDPQTQMQQKIMNYMMIFMGVLFYKVASGLCLYFIASSLWSIGEKKLLPKLIGAPSRPAAKDQSAARTPALTAAASGNGAGRSAAQRKKNRGRR